MIQTGIESRVKIQDIVLNQLPEFVLDESPKTIDFLKQYYISQEYQGGPVDLSDNLDQYLKVDNLKPEVIVDNTLLTSNITSSDTTIQVSSTKGFPSQYGLLKIDEEIITYTGITTNSFTGCIRGFSGISEFNQESFNKDLVFSTSTASEHSSNANIQNLSSLFLKEFYKKLKSTFTPGLENIAFADEIDAGNFIKRAKDFYASKGTDEAIKILFKVIFAESPSIINLEDYLIKPSSANYIRREVVVAEVVSGEPLKIVGETLVKTTDESTTASISSVEPFTRKGKTFYIIEFYVSNDGRSSVEGNFVITPNTKLTETVSIGDSVINVDSTVSFPESGNLVSGNNTISYTSKSINQFFGCSGILSTIDSTSNVRSNDTYFSYENGDLNKKVEIIILGVIEDLKEKSDNFKTEEGDIITIKNLGDKIKNNGSNWKEIFANSLIYNTSARYEILDNSSNKLGSIIDRSSLKIGDEVEILTRGSNTVEFSSNPVYIQDIDETQNTLTLENKPNLGANQKYDIRRKLNKTKSSGSNFESNSLISDVLNLYVDNDEYAYVASNSLPSTIRNDFNVNNYRLDVQANIKSVSIGSTNNLSDFSNEVYNSFTVNSVPFLTGDEIFYSPEEAPLVGLVTGTYFVEKVSNTNFKLYGSRSLISLGNNLTFTPPTSGIGTHTFTLNSQKDSVLGIQKILRKIPLEKNINLGTGELTVPGTTGILINGVEIQNYKSDDAIYFGPIESAKVLSGGEDFDVINNPKIEVSSGIGTIAKIQPVISGKFEKVYVDSQDYNIDNIVLIEISGGNGKGAVIEPVLVNRPRNVLFNADESTTGGGVNQSTNQISFLTDHNFINGQQVIYNSLGNNPISIGTAGYNFELPDNSSYFVEVTNNKTIKLYYNLDDQQSGNNPVGIFTGSSGSHRFSTVDTKKQVDYIKIIDGGEGYSNRKLIVKSSGISTTENTITFKNHGFNDGELINYNYESSEISGITTANQYYVLKINDDSFRICDAGVGGTITSNYERQNYEKFNSTGSGYQYFSYPEISVSIKYSTTGIGSTTQEKKDLIITPVVKGKIVDTYVYENGTGYGSTVLNYEDKPTVTIQNGKLAQLTPVVVGDKIVSVSVSYEGTQYNSVPELVVSGSGTGAELRAIIDNGRISEVKVINAGIGYSASNTTIQVISSGKNAIIDPQIRKLTVNDNSERFSSGEVLKSGKDKLQYSVSKYFESLRNSFLENSGSLSGIIGWAYDGNPIYGPYAYTDPNNISSVLKTLESGYVLDTSNVVDRPSGFQGGFFVEDYKFDNSGDLDEYNGRYEKNNEFPNGVYAYHATIDEFPYFIGNKYQSKLISDSNLNQSFDFSNSNLLRNTFPYKVSDINADYDFINETSDVLDQKIEVISVTSGPIESVEIQNSGDNYRVNDKLIFDEEDTSGSGLNVDVKSVKGKNVVDVSTDSVSFSDSIFTWESSNKIKVSIIPNHNLSNLDYVTISGFSTNLSELNGTHRILVSSNPDARCLSAITSSGITTEIYVAPIPEQISVGSSIGIGTETLKVLGIFRNENILRIERESVGTSHTVGTAVSFLSDSFTISKSVEKFDSKVNEKRFFNPRESIGVSTISGVGFSTSFIFGNNSITRSIPSKSIRIENHPFVTNQSVVYTSNGTNISVSTDGLDSSKFDLPANLFVVNKNSNLIGLKTAVNGNELFFHTNGDDNDQYLLESNYDQILGDVEKNEVTVSVSTSHELKNGDFVTLDIQPNLSVGIGTSTAVRILYNSEINAVLVDPIGFNSTGINTTTNEITVLDHGLKTGDKVLYEDNNYNEYFVFKINNNKFNLCETYIDSQQNPPTVVSFASTGSASQTISLINPEINLIRNNNLVFDLSDSSLTGYKFKLYEDSEFKNEFVSTGSTNNFIISEVGSPGLSTTSSLTLNYISDIPEELYYTIQNNGVNINSDIDVKNYSKIKYIDSKYNNTYSVSGIGTTSFKVNINQKPERLSYGSTECDVIDYSTSSLSASGPVNSLNILSFGSGYKKLPKLKSVTTTNGIDLIVNPKSNLIGSVREKNILNDRFTYSSDKTLRPEANVSPTIELKDFGSIDDILIVNGGEGYVSPPLLTLVNSTTREVIDSGLLKVNLTGSAISSIDINVEPTGLPDETVEVFATNNTNGVSIIEVESSNTGIFTCTISTPNVGVGTTSFFAVKPFNDGDQVFIEGIVKNSAHGTGFNSKDYGFKFFTVSDYNPNGVNDKVTLNISGLTTNTGIANTIQNYSGTIINKNEYPEFKVSQKQSKFFIGESLSSNNVIRDLKVAENNGNDLKVSGTYELSVGENIKGVESGTKATINSLKSNEAVFDVEYSNLKDIGWNSEIGKLSEDYQVIEDNDYYQNLSYSVKSSITYKDQQAPVESLVHTSGLKNFADTGISSSVSAGLDKTNDGFTVIYDLISEKRVDTINNFDNVVDEDIVNSTSKFLKLENVKLTNFTELTNMNVLKIDDISGRFSNSESENTEFLTVNEVDDKTYHNYLLRVTNEDGTEIQITDLTILSTGFETVIVENESLQNSNTPYGTFDLDENEFSETFLKFFPDDPFNKNYDVKLIEQTFDEVFSGVGTQPVGFASLTSSTVSENTVTGIGTTTISSFNSNDFESIYVNAQVLNKLTNDMNYVRLYITHDGTDTYMSEYYIDNDLSSSTGDPIGLFTCTNLGSGIFSLVHENNTGNELEIRSNIVGFGATAVGVGTYRFKSSEQLDGQERSVIYQSDFQSTVGVASTTIHILDKTLFNASKSVVQVSVGSSKALHQVMMIFDETDVYTQQLPFLSVDTTNNPLDTLSGIGTFGGEVSGNDLLLKFYPDDQNQQTDIEIFNKSFYSILDTMNDYQDLTYGSVVEKIDEKFYNAINGDRINKTNFELTSNNIPIFSKTFNPNSVSLASTSGLFSIDSHFFMTGEELIYTPDSTIVGVGTSAMMINATDVLPSTVYAIKVSENTFKVAITTSAAQSGTGVTFASLGEGNAHRFTMKEKNTKCIIDVDELVQYPVRFSGITHSLSENLASNATFAVLSDISSINPTDLLLIDDEYVKVINVGLGTTSVGPITNSGNVKLVQLDRGVVGSLANTHANSASVSIHRGSFNIVDNQIHFSDAPRGNPQIDKTNSNLDFETSSFGGRVFLKSNYDDNKIYDDISNQFTGIGRTFNLTVGGANTTGIGTDGGSGLVFVNNIYQSPKTDNNPTIFNYEISEGVGITTIEFSGITRPDNILEYVSSDSDINQNETPRGGIIVSFGSTPGLGFAPLVGASVTAVVGAGGSIVSVGLGTTDNLGSGYNGLVSIGVSVFEEGHSGTPAQITATPNVGAGGTLSFNVVSGGTGYNNPQIFVSDPSYDNLPITGVSREGIGSTTETGIGLLMDIIVGGSSTSGIGSTYFEVKEFKFSRPGYAFKRGDVFKPIGIVTDSTLSSPLADFTVTVIDTYSDNFAAWEFGELDYIDSIKNLQDGTRVRFPLNYNGELLSFEAEEGSPIQQNINNVLIIFINGVIQEPVKNYIFNGGTSFVFTKAPLPEDDVEIYFYKGVDGTDASSVDNVRPTIKVGDTLQVISNNDIENTITQDERIAFNIAFSDKVETNKYFGQGIDLINPKPVSWTKQKTDRKINGEFVGKSRDVLEPLIFPTAKIIKDVSTTDTEVFIENSELFSYETDNGYNDPSVPCDGLIVNGISTVGYSTGLVEKIAGFSAINGSSGIITGITTSAGSGSNPLAIVFSIIDNGATLSGIETGYPIYIHDTNVGNGVTSINSSDSEIVGIGTTCLDNIYYISDWSSSSLIGSTYVGVITCNVHSDTDITGISTTGSHPNNIVGRYSWGKLSGGTRSSSPISIGVTGNIVSGLSTYPTIQRRGGINIRKTGALPKIES